ncbi:MAG: HemK2/MTQ2 family protein methyltransferase [Halobacteriales archaeon]
MVPDDPEGTASLSDLRGGDDDVYEPAEDSAILAGEVVADLAEAEPGTVLDVGTGSGYIGAKVAAATDAKVVGLDVNPAACRRAREAGLEAVRGDLTAPFAADTFDAVVFNPPYLPAMPEADWEDWFEVAVTGGASGRELIDRFLESVGRVLMDEGSVYLLVSSLSGVDTVVETAAHEGFSAAALADAAFAGETLTVLKLVR